MDAAYTVGRADRQHVGHVRRLASLAWQHRDDRRWWGIALVAVLFGASVTAFAHVVEDYLTGDPIVRWDVEFARWLHTHSSPALVRVFEVLTLGGNVIVLALLTSAAVLLLLRRRAINDALLVASVALGIEILNAVLKLVFHRPRPELAFVHLDTYSFPSGHAAGSAAIYGVLAFVLATRVRGAARVAVVAATVVFVALIGFSRLYLGAHYLSDVLAGLSLGAAWLFGWLLLALVFRDRDASTLLPPAGRRLVERIAGA